MRNLLGVSFLMVASSPCAAADVGGSINIGEPGFYG